MAESWKLICSCNLQEQSCILFIADLKHEILGKRISVAAHSQSYVRREQGAVWQLISLTLKMGYFANPIILIVFVNFEIPNWNIKVEATN